MLYNPILNKLRIAEWLPFVQLAFLICNNFMFQSRYFEAITAIFLFWLSSLYPIHIIRSKTLHFCILILTNFALYYQLDWVAASLIIVANNIYPCQKLSIWMLFLAIILLQNQILFYGFASIAAVLFLTQKIKYVKYNYNFSYKPKVVQLLGHLFLATAITLMTVGIYLGSLPFLKPQQLAFALLPILALAYHIKSRPNIDYHYSVGYIFWFWLFAGILMVLNGYMLPIIDTLYPIKSSYDFIFLALQITVQVLLLACLFYIIKIQCNTFTRICPKKNTLFYHQIMSSFFLISNIIILPLCLTADNISLYQWYTTLIIWGCAIYTALKYPFYLIKVAIRKVFINIFKLDIIGQDSIEDLKKPLIIISNHLSLIDVPLIGSIFPLRFIFPINPTIAKMKIVRIGKVFTQIFPIKPTHSQKLRPFIQMIKLMSNGVIFPEGHRSSTGNLLKIYDGTGFCARLSNANILPIYLDGPQLHLTARPELTRPKYWFPQITVNIGKPFKIDHPKHGDRIIFKKLLQLHCSMPHERTFYTYFQKTKRLVNSDKTLLFYKDQVYNYQAIIKALRKIHISHNEFLNINEYQDINPLLIIKALCKKIPLVIGPIDTYKKEPDAAISYFIGNRWEHMKLEDIFKIVKLWDGISEITPSDSVFYQENNITAQGLIFGVITPLLTGHATVIGTEKGRLISEEIYEQRNTVLIADKNLLEKLLNFHHYYNLSTIRKVFAIDAEALSKQWEEEYISPFFNILTNQQGQLDRLSTPRFKNGISINELRESNIDI